MALYLIERRVSGIGVYQYEDFLGLSLFVHFAVRIISGANQNAINVLTILSPG